MEIVAKYSEVREETFTQATLPQGVLEASWQHGPVHEMLQCPACKAITLRSYHWDDNLLGDPLDYHILYPAATTNELGGLPDHVARAYEAARRVRTIDPNAYAVLVGRVVELICEDRAAKGRFLSHKLSDLAKRGEIPTNLVPVAKTLADLRNVGAHSSLGELTSGEVPLLDDLVRSILEYVYTAPYVAQCANERLQRLIEKRKARGDRVADELSRGTTAPDHDGAAPKPSSGGA